jgi:hypothetical protein
MAKFVVESMAPVIIQALRNLRFSSVRWLPSQGST